MFHQFSVLTQTQRRPSIGQKFAIGQKLSRRWINAKFCTKLAILLIAGAALPTGLVLYGLVYVSGQHLLGKMQNALQKDLGYFQQQMAQLNRENALLASSLANQIEMLALSDRDLSTAVPQGSRDQLLNWPMEPSFPISFAIVTDAQGKVIQQKVELLNSSPKALEALPKAESTPTPVITSAIQSFSGVDFSQMPIVRQALQRNRPLSGYEITPAQLLQQLGLGDQANIGLRPQKLEGLPDAKKPFPEGTYNLEQGQAGLVSLAVHPIKHNNQVIGSAIVGTLINRNASLVDTIQQKTGVATATLFAYDWRISTNVPTLDGQQRALGTRVARQVAESVLQQGKPFVGQTNIVGQEYLTAYAPLYDHQHLLNAQSAKPVGIIYVGNPLTKVEESIASLIGVGYVIGGVVLVGVVILSIPLSNTFSTALRQLTQFAEQIGDAAEPVDQAAVVRLQHRQDEIGILARELAQMVDRLHHHLQTIRASELQTRAQADQLQLAMTELQQTQVQLVQTEKMSSLGQLVAGVAHEINNPTNFIHGNLNCVVDYLKDLRQAIALYQKHYPQPSAEILTHAAECDLPFVLYDLPRLVDSMQEGTRRIREIVLSLRNFSRLDEAEQKQANLNEGLDSTLLILTHKLRRNPEQTPIQVIKEYNELPLTFCHPSQLNQVFLNILSNAIDALEPIESPKITLKTHRQEDNIIVTISDNGIGMSQAVQAKLFDPFFTTKAVGQGTGLGMSISYQIITQKHGGQIHCRSTLGQGTTFTLRIPVTGVDELNLSGDDYRHKGP